ncbi:MAG: TMEM175 family protein [Bacteroidia bacterium]
MEIKEHKKNMQLDRIILFSDAVFAIAITLLVIELRLPELDEISNRALGNALLHTIPHFFSFLLSFMIIGIYWVAHHKMFSYVVNYDARLMWLNLLLLFFIALMPFSSNVYGVHTPLNVAFMLYVFNILMLGIFIFLLYSYISKPGKNLSYGLENPRLVAYYRTRSLAVPACFMTGVIIALISSSPVAIILSRSSPLLIFPVFSMIRKKYADVIS